MCMCEYLLSIYFTLEYVHHGRHHYYFEVKDYLLYSKIVWATLVDVCIWVYVCTEVSKEEFSSKLGYTF